MTHPDPAAPDPAADREAAARALVQGAVAAFVAHLGEHQGDLTNSEISRAVAAADVDEAWAVTWRE